MKVLKDTIARTEEKTRADMERIRGENVVLLGNLADTGRKMATLQALLRQQQARVAHSRAIQRQLTQKLRDLDPTAAHGTARGGAAAWGTGGGGLDDLEGADSLENEESLPEQGASEWGQWAGRADAKALGRTSELQKASPEKALSELANPLPLPRLPHFGPPPVRGASAASASAGQPDKDRHKRPTVAPRRLTSTPGAGQESMIVRPATAMAPPVSPTAQVDWRPATAAAQERPLETSVSESNLAPAKNFAGRLAKLGQSPSFGRLAMGPALVNPGLASAVSQGDVGSSRIGEEEQNERNNAFRRATSLRRKSSQNADKSIADLEVQNAMPMRKVASSRQSLDSTDSEVQNAMSTRESATSRQSIESTESR